MEWVRSTRWRIGIIGAITLVVAGLVMAALHRPSDVGLLQTMTISGHVTAVALDAAADRIVAGSNDGYLYLWTRKIEELSREEQGRMSATASYLDYLDQSGSSRGNNLPDPRRLWDEYAMRHLAGHECTVGAAVFSPNNRYLVTAGRGGALLQWDRSDDWAMQEFIAKPSGACSGSGSDIRSIAFRPDSTVVAVGGARQVRLFATETGATIHTFDTNEAIEALAFSPDGQLLVGGSAHTVLLWRVESAGLTRVFTQSAQADQAIAFQGDAHVMLGNRVEIEVRLVYNGRQVYRRAVGPDSARQLLTLSSDGELAALSGIPRTDNAPAIFPWIPALDTRLYLAPTSSLNNSKVLVGHEEMVTVAAFSQDGRRLVSGSSDGTIRLWRVPDF